MQNGTCKSVLCLPKLQGRKWGNLAKVVVTQSSLSSRLEYRRLCYDTGGAKGSGASMGRSSSLMYGTGPHMGSCSFISVTAVSPVPEIKTFWRGISLTVAAET
jgi:hypothetical protein